MASRKTFIQKILNELPILKSQQLIDDASFQRLDEHYRKELSTCPSSSTRYLTLALVTLGAIMITAGLGLLIAHNWDMFGKPLRISIAAIPLCIGTVLGVYTIVRDKDARWQEASAMLTAGGVSCLCALVSQIYHIQGELSDFMMLVMAVTLPLLYIFNSFGYAAVYCLGIGFLFKNYELPIIALPYVAGALPFLIYHMFRDAKSHQAAAARYLAVPVLVYVIVMKNPQLQLIALGSLLYLGGLEFKRRNIPLLRNPWLFSGWILLTVMLLIGSSTKYFWEDFFNVGHEIRHWCILFFFYLCCSLLAIDGFRNRSATTLKTVIALSCLFVPGMFCLSDNTNILLWLANLYLLIMGIVLMINSAKDREILGFNAGMIQVFILFMVRFFDSDVSILIRAGAFIILGLAFIGANIFIGRKFRNERRKSHE